MQTKIELGSMVFLESEHHPWDGMMFQVVKQYPGTDTFVIESGHRECVVSRDKLIHIKDMKQRKLLSKLEEILEEDSSQDFKNETNTKNSHQVLNHDVVPSSANGQSFYYCRDCKIEVE